MHSFIGFQRDAFSVPRTLVVILDLRFDRVKGCDTQMFLASIATLLSFLAIMPLIPIVEVMTL